MKNRFLTSGKFAKLCRTTRETVLHYDRIGLLKPRRVSGNGYRRYGPEQFYDFDIISILKDTGGSLNEIAAIRKAGAESFLELLDEKKLALEQERARLARRQDRLEDFAALMREYLETAYDVFAVVDQEEERLDFIPDPQNQNDVTAETIGSYVDSLNRYEGQGRMGRTPYGIFIRREDVALGGFAKTFIFSRASRDAPAKTLHIKPKGVYAALSHKGPAESQTRIYAELLGRIAEKGLKIIGNAYIYDMMGHIFTADDPDEYALRYCVQVG